MKTSTTLSTQALRQLKINAGKAEEAASIANKVRAAIEESRKAREASKIGEFLEKSREIEKKTIKGVSEVIEGTSKTVDKLGSDALKKIGAPAENSGIRAVTGNADDAYNFFKAQVNPNTIKEVKPGTFVGKDSNGITFTYRASSKSRPPTIDVNGVSGLRKIKFINGGSAK